MSYQVTIGLSLGTSKTGLTLEAQPVSTAGASVGSALTTGFVEYGGGQYSWTGSLPDGHTGGVKFQLSGGGAFQAFAPINPPEVENPDVKTSTRNSVAPDNTSIATILTRTDVATSTRSSHSAADVWAVGTRTLTGFGTLVADVAAAVWGAATRTLSAFGFTVTVATNQDKTGYSLATAPPTLTGIVNGVLDAPLSGHTTAGTVAAGISLASSGGGGGGGGTDPLTNLYPGAYADGTYGAYLRDKLGLIHVDQVVVQNPINPTTNVITLIRGDAYNPATRRLVWTLTGYPDLTGAAVQLSINGGDPIVGSVLSHTADGSAQDVAVDVTSAQSAALAGSLQPASATVILASSDPMTFWAGYVDARGKAAT